MALPQTVTQPFDYMKELQATQDTAEKKTTDLQTQQSDAEKALRAQQDAATQPVQQQRQQAGQGFTQALEKGPEVAPLPKNEARHIDQKQMSDTASSMMALAGLAGLVIGAPLTVSLKGMTGAMKGLQEGDQKQFEESYQKYKDNMNEALKLNDEKLKEYDRALKGKEFNIRELDNELTNIAHKYGDQITLNARDFKTKIESVQAQEKAHENLLKAHDLTMQHMEDHKIKLEELALKRKAAEGSGSGGFTPDDLKFMAQQRLAGDKTVFQNLGRGAQGAKNLIALRHAVMEEAKNQKVSPQEMAMLDSEMAGITAGERTLGTRTANVEMAGNEAKRFIDIANAASEKVDRTRFKDLNSVILAGEKGSGGEDVVRLATATNSLINAYARAISPSGSPTVSDKEHAREILDTAFSKGQFKAATDVMAQEIEAARASPSGGKEALRGLRGITPSSPASPYSDPDKEQRYQKWKAEHGQ